MLISMIGVKNLILLYGVGNIILWYCTFSKTRLSNQQIKSKIESQNHFNYLLLKAAWNEKNYKDLWNENEINHKDTHTPNLIFIYTKEQFR